MFDLKGSASRDNVDSTVFLELHDAAGFREKRKVIAASNVLTGTKLAADLPHDNATGRYNLAAVSFYTAALRL